MSDRSGKIILQQTKLEKEIQIRYDHPLEQADKVELNKKGEVKDIGKEIYKKTHAEFLGLLKILSWIKIFIKHYNKLKRLKLANAIYFIKFLIKRK